MHPSRIHLLGHSLGGRGAGQIGREVEKLTGVKIKRISSLDPAGPLFSFTVIPVPSVSLKATDADVVDALHTTSTAGVMASIGTVDFFANSLINSQPGYGPLGVVCSHARRDCSLWLHMSNRASGTYTFETNSKQPYAKGKQGCRKNL